MVPEDVLRRMVEVIRRDRELTGCRVGFVGNNQCRLLDQGVFMLPAYDRFAVVIEEIAPGSIRELLHRLQPQRSGPAQSVRPVEHWDARTIQSTANFLSDIMDDSALRPSLNNLHQALRTWGMLASLSGLSRPDRMRRIQTALERATSSREGVAAVNRVLRESHLAATPGWGSSANAQGPIMVDPRQMASQIRNDSRTGREITAAGLDCTFAIVSGFGVFGGVAAEAPTGGASTFLVVLAWTGFITSGAQCLNGLIRLTQVIGNPHSYSLSEWDQNTVYSWASTIVDVVGTGASLLQMRSLWRVLRLTETEADFVRLSRSAQIEKVREALERTGRTQEGREALQTALRTFEHSRFQLRPPTFRISPGADAALRWVGASASRRISAAITGILVEASELGSTVLINLVLKPDQN